MVGVGVGTAAAAAIEPIVEPGKQAAWDKHRNRLLDPGVLARLVAQGGITLGAAQAEAHLDGFADDKIDRLVYLAQTVPGVGEALRILRRAPAFADLFQHALVKQGIDPRYHPGLTDLQHERLPPAVIALAIVRGIMADPGYLPVGPPAAEGKVRAFPRSAIPTLAEAASWGWDSDRLFVQTAISGRPMGPEGAARAVFRNILERVDFDRAISEGDVRNEWGDAIFEAARAILSPHDWAELQLRGFATEAERNAGAGALGMTAENAQLLYEMLGRSISVHQVTTGLARGGTFGGTGQGIPPVYLQTMQRSNVRPEYYDLDYANRYSYPTAFFFRLLLTTGAITADQGNQYFLELGWPPVLARTVADALAPGAGAGKTDPYVKKADSQLWTALHKAYVKTGVDRATVESAMTVLVDSVADREIIFERWDTERTIDQVAGPPA